MIVSRAGAAQTISSITLDGQQEASMTLNDLNSSTRIPSRALGNSLLALLLLTGSTQAQNPCSPNGSSAPHLSLRPDGAGGINLVLQDGPGGAQAFLMGIDPGGGGASPTRPLLPACAGLVEGDLMQTITLDAMGAFTLPLGPTSIGLDRPELSALCIPVGGTLVDSVVSNRVAFEAHTGDASTQYGSVVISEFMKDPAVVSDAHGEWIELINLTSQPIDIEGWILMDDGSDETYLDNGGSGIVILPQAHFVVGRDVDMSTNGGVVVDHQISGFTLSNGDDEIVIWSTNGVLIDELRYDDGVSWPDDAGDALSLDPNKLQQYFNDDGAAWCSATTPIVSGGSDMGSPGVLNPNCP
ncbi:MAG: hypothetical protein ACI841_003302 [Planctomycetota bacterium]